MRFEDLDSSLQQKYLRGETVTQLPEINTLPVLTNQVISQFVIVGVPHSQHAMIRVIGPFNDAIAARDAMYDDKGRRSELRGAEWTIRPLLSLEK